MSLSSYSERVVFDLPGVCAVALDGVGTSSNIPGILSIVERPFGIFIEWNPIENLSPVEEGANDWVMTDSVSFSNGTENVDVKANAQQRLKRLRINLDVKDLRSFLMRNENSDTEASVKFIGRDGASFAPLIFRMGGCNDFVASLQKYACLKRSAKDNGLILISDEKAEALQQSVTMLFKENSQDMLSKLWSNPYATAVTGLGKVANFLQDHIVPALLDMNQLDTDEQRETIKSLLELKKAEDSENVHAFQDPAGFEYVTKYVLPTRPDVNREEAMSQLEWRGFLNEDGSVNNVRDLKLRIFRGGVAPEIRSEVWPFLLGVYDWTSTTNEREKTGRDNKDSYYRMKLQWKTINDDQESRFADFRDRKALIEKDVARTDRNHKFFEGDNNTHVSSLYDVLMTYLMYNFDLGYVQGMSDLLSPLMVNMENEVDSFWAFVGFMNKVHNNFEMDQKSIKYQLMQLRDLLMVVNPHLMNYLESHDSDNMYFCFRWILVLFKREFSFSDIMKLWEVFWTDMPCKNFHLLVCLAILEKQKELIVENKFGFTEILKHINDLSMTLNLDELLRCAEGIYHQLAATQDKLPSHICDYLGFRPFRESAAIRSSSNTLLSPVKGGPGTARRLDDADVNSRSGSSIEVVTVDEPTSLF